MAAELGRRYAEMLGDNLEQPGFREVLLAIHDIDGRRDLVGGLLAGDAQAAFQARRGGLGPREAEVVDWTSPQRALVADFLQASLRLPFAVGAARRRVPRRRATGAASGTGRAIGPSCRCDSWTKWPRSASSR